MAEGYQDTDKQRELVGLVLGAADEGRFISLQELHARVSYGSEVRNTAIQCSMKFLAKHGLIERFRSGRYTHYRPTRLAYQLYRPG